MTDLLPPTEIPDLSSLQGMAEWTAVVRGIAGGGSEHSKAFALQMNCIRLLDGAVFCYEQGRFLIRRFHAKQANEFGLGYIALAGTNFESCIWNFERFLKHARALRSYADAEQDLRGAIPAKLGFLSQSVESRITKLRHTLAHLEGAALKGEVPNSTSIALLPTKCGLAVGSHLVTWVELRDWLTEAHETVVALANFKPPSVADKATMCSTGPAGTCFE